MTDFTRRTHVVRISDAAPGDPPSDTYIDIEVLDAIAFRTKNNDEVILNCPAIEEVAFIKDDTGGGHGQTPADPTRLSHMKRIIGTDRSQQLDVEVIECMSFRDQNGDEWILDMGKTSDDPSTFDITTSTGSSRATRRVHTEKISDDLTNAHPTNYVSVVRNDNIAFRTTNGDEVIFSCPSCDDPHAAVGFGRASTFITSPQGYEPGPNGPTPPPNTDSNKYVAFVNSASGFLTGDTKIQQGPLWWIRYVSPGGSYLLITITATNTAHTSVVPAAPTVEIDFGDPKKGPIAKLLDEDDQGPFEFTGLGEETIFFVWADAAPFPTADDYDHVISDGLGTQYFAQFARTILVGSLGFAQTPAPGANTAARIGSDGQGKFNTFEDAQNYANFWNNDRQFAADGAGYFADDGSEVHLNVVRTVHAASLTLPSVVISSSEIANTYLLKIPKEKTTTKFKITLLSSLGQSAINGLGYSDVKKPLKKITDAGTFGETEDVAFPPDAAAPDKPIRPPDVTFDSSAISNIFDVVTQVVAGTDPKVKAHHVQIQISAEGPTA